MALNSFLEAPMPKQGFVLFAAAVLILTLTNPRQLFAERSSQHTLSAKPGANETVYGFEADSIQGRSVTLSRYKGKVILIVNVASKCGFTPQYKGLEALYQKYKSKGLVILGFPCNQFHHQEPGDAAEIQSFCRAHYGVTFPLFAKIEVNGPNANPLYQFLKKAEPDPDGKLDIGWNFTKFLIDRKGRPLARFVSKVTPEEIDADIARALRKN